MIKRVLIAVAVVALGLSLLPAGASRDIPTLLSQAPQRFVPKPAGTEETLSFLFGPYLIPPGQDRNLITPDLPVTTGFFVSVAPDLIDAVTGETPTEQVAHIHHAHWLRVTNDSQQYEMYSTGLSWVFGTGEEKTQGSLDSRAALEPNAPRYGIFIDGTTPQTLIFMIHNKTSQPQKYFVTLDVTLVHGTRAEIQAASPTHRDIHPLAGTLWGETKDATPLYRTLSKAYTATHDGTAVAAGGHLHPGGKEVAVTNLGPNEQCTADTDGDGFPGVTILHSRKYDRIQGAWPYSEDYQMGATKFGWRAPIHKGDVLRQFAPYDVDNPVTPGIDTVDGQTHAYYEAMSYTGIYVDREQLPAPIPESDVCNPANYRARLLGADTPAVQSGTFDSRYVVGANEGMINHEWEGVDPDPLCGLHTGTAAYDGACENGPAWAPGPGLKIDTVHVSAFTYLPGDLSQSGMAGAPPQVAKGSSLRFINDDAALNVRHTITSCPAPCAGKYVANYPVPDGRFDSGKLGNLDYIDGGITGNDTVPIWDSPTTLGVGLYTYYCRIHPWMRGAFEVVA